MVDRAGSSTSEELNAQSWYGCLQQYLVYIIVVHAELEGRGGRSSGNVLILSQNSFVGGVM